MKNETNFVLGIAFLPDIFAENYFFISSVAHPDPYVFGSPGSGSVSQWCGSGSGSGSFCHQAKIIRKAFIPTVL
jgi:hypothetical protein